MNGSVELAVRNTFIANVGRVTFNLILLYSWDRNVDSRKILASSTANLTFPIHCGLKQLSGNRNESNEERRTRY